MRRARVVSAAIVLAACQATAQFATYGPPTDPAGNPVLPLTWSGPPQIGTQVSISQPLCCGIGPLGYGVLCGNNLGSGDGHQLIIGVAPTSILITPAMTPLLCDTQRLLVASPFILLPMGPTWVPSPGGIEPLWISGWATLIDIPADPGLVGLTFYAQATTHQQAPAGCSQCPYRLSGGIQATVQ